MKRIVAFTLILIFGIINSPQAKTSPEKILQLGGKEAHGTVIQVGTTTFKTRDSQNIVQEYITDNHSELISQYPGIMVGDEVDVFSFQAISASLSPLKPYARLVRVQKNCQPPLKTNKMLNATVAGKVGSKYHLLYLPEENLTISVEKLSHFDGGEYNISITPGSKIKVGIKAVRQLHSMGMVYIVTAAMYGN